MNVVTFLIHIVFLFSEEHFQCGHFEVEENQFSSLTTCLIITLLIFLVPSDFVVTLLCF